MHLSALHPDLTHPDPGFRSAGLEALRTEASPRTLAQAAAALLADPDPGVRETAAQVLLDLANEEAARLTVPYIASDNITVRNRAGELLAQMGEAAIDALLPYVDDEDYDVRKFAIDVLALLPARRVAHRIAVHLDDPDANVRIAAVDALGALGACEYAEALRSLYEREPVARASVVAAFGAFGPGYGDDLIVEALSDEDPVVQ
ncbi:MAG: HEAT repeat domain-containing protein, partial [Bacteroidetes bacterium]